MTTLNMEDMSKKALQSLFNKKVKSQVHQEIDDLICNEVEKEVKRQKTKLSKAIQKEVAKKMPEVLQSCVNYAIKNVKEDIKNSLFKEKQILNLEKYNGAKEVL